MKRKLYFLTIFMCIFSGLGLSNLNAQTTTVTIGNETNAQTNGGIPFDIWASKNICQQLFTANEINHAGGTINSIAIKFKGDGSTKTYNRKVAIYINNSTDLDYLSKGVNIPSSQVANFDGTITLVQEEWVEFVFTTPFEYTGGNIIVTMYDYSGYSSGGDFYYFYVNTVQEGRVVFINNYGGDVSNFNGYSANSTVERNIIKFTFEGGAAPEPTAPSAPTNLQATVNGTSVTLTWNAVSGATNYNVYINNSSTIQTTDPTYTITGLNPATTYCFTVTALNEGGEESSLSDEVCVKTDEIKRYRIKSVDYEGKYLNIAQITSSNTDGKSGVDVAAYAESDMQIFTIEDAGNNNVYFRAASEYYISCLGGWMVCAYGTTTGYATPLRMLDQGDGTFIILCNDGYFKVETVSGGLYPFSNGNSSQAALWTLEEVNSSTPGVAPSVPTNLRATAVTDISVNLSWDASANATSYNVYKDETLISNVSETSFQIMGLDPVTQYCFTVTALNEGVESSHSAKLCVTTLSSAGSDADKVIGDWVGADPLPIYTTNEYAYSQQIYTSEELGINVACEINEISFYKTNTYSATRHLEIYMLNTDKSSFSTNDWENIYDSYKVFDGEYTFTEQSESEGENECRITLDTSFLYIPGKNILVCVVDKTATKEANLLRFQVYETDGYQSITTYGASKRKLSKLNGFSGINPASYKIGKGYKNRIRLYYQTASAGVLAIPSAIELAFALQNPDNDKSYWSGKSIHQKTITIIAKNTNITDIRLDDDDDDSFFDIPDNIDYNVNPIVFEVKHDGTLTSGSKTANLVITYIGGVETVPLSAVTYTPVEPDVFELPREVDLSTGTYTDTPDFTTLHDDYILPGEGTDGNAPDAVYVLELTKDEELNVEVLGDKGIYAIYKADDLIPYDGPGPSDDNIFVPGASSDVDFFCDFEIDPDNGDYNAFEGLTLMDVDKDGRNWEIAVGEGLEGSYAATSMSGYEIPGYIESYSPQNYLVTDKKYKIDKNSVLSFYAKSYSASYADGYVVMVSEDLINFDTVFTKKAVKTEVFEKQEIPLSNFAERELYIVINHNTVGMYNLYIDNVMLSRGGSGSGSGSSNIYPAGTYYVVAAAESEFTVRITIKMDEIPTFTGVGNWNEQARWNVDYIPNSADIDVIIDGTATITEDVVIRSVEIKEDRSLTVGTNKSLTVVGLIETDNANKLVLEDGAQLFQTNDEVLGKFRMNIVAPTVIGDYSPEDEMNPTGWQFISSPMKNAATAGFETADDKYDLFKYDGDVATEKDLEWINYKGHDDFEAKFQQGRGYMASYAENGIAEFVGEFNNATSFTFDGLKYHGDDIKAQIDNFHLLGNPFTFDMKWNNNNIAASGLAEGYAVVTTAGGYTYATTGEIKVGDGFFVKVVGDAPSLTYTANTRSRNKDNNYINLIASGKAGQDNVIINFADNGRDGFDKLENFNKNIAEIYVKENESRYGILNYSEDVEEINIYFNAKKMGYYTINALTNADFANVTLVDRLTGVETDILTDSYTFQAMADDAPDRFILRMNRQVESESFVYRSGEELIINAEGSVQIIDVMGRIVYSNEIVNDNHRVNIGSLKNAAYIVRVVNANEVKTQKVVIW